MAVRQLVCFFVLIVIGFQLAPAQNRQASGTSIPFVRHFGCRPTKISLELGGVVPKTAYLRIERRISSSDTILIYELGNWTRELCDDHSTVNNLTAPNTQIVVLRHAKPVFQLSLKDAEADKQGPWDEGLVLMAAARLDPGADSPIYLAFGSGNWGRFFATLQPVSEGYRMIPIGNADQGRMVLFRDDPRRVDIWNEDDPAECNACPKPFIVQTYRFDGKEFRPSAKHRTKRAYRPSLERVLFVQP